jgi:hypothetical protein
LFLAGGKTWVKKITDFFLSGLLLKLLIISHDTLKLYFYLHGLRVEARAHPYMWTHSRDQWMAMENNIPMCWSSVPRVQWRSSPSYWVLHTVSVKCTRKEEFKCKRELQSSYTCLEKIPFLPATSWIWVLFNLPESWSSDSFVLVFFFKSTTADPTRQTIGTPNSSSLAEGWSSHSFEDWVCQTLEHRLDVSHDLEIPIYAAAASNSSYRISYGHSFPLFSSSIVNCFV